MSSKVGSVRAVTWFNLVSVLCLHLLVDNARGGDDDYNIVHRDSSFQFGYNTPDSYHHAAGSRNNVVRGEFGGKNPATGQIDSTLYTAGPRGYRPVGKNIHRKFDLNQNGRRPVGSPDDPYYDPYEDPSYNFAFRTRTYNRQENANRVGDVTGKYNYVDDVGEVHNVEFIAGKNTGFHVKTPFPDSNPRSYGPLYFRGRGKPIPRGRTSIQRGLDGSYRFVSVGSDQRRTETSDSTGHVRGSYTYLDDKGVQHSVHYIAGPETGYRVLKNVKGPHLPSVFPFERPEILPGDFYDDGKEDLFDGAASGHFKPSRPFNTGSNSFGKPQSETGDEGKKPDTGSENIDSSNPDQEEGSLGGDFDGELFGPSFGSRPASGKPSGSSSFKPGDGGSGSSFKPGGGASGSSFQPGASGSGSSGKPGAGSLNPAGTDGSNKPSAGGDLFGNPGSSSSFNPSNVNSGAYIPPGDSNQDDGSYKPGPNESGLDFETPELPKPGLGDSFGSKPPKPFVDDYDYGNGLFGSESNLRPPYNSGNNARPILEIKPACESCQGTIVTNIGDKQFSVPPGVSVRAHVQSIDLLPLQTKVPSPSEQYNKEMNKAELNSAASSIVTNTTATTTAAPTTTVLPETTTLPLI